ncbi:hypothetical protein [Sphingobium aquiterrae]|uniref:hypothetical protein n=1 Tax=Sphingobium aquiterrae TaxID=2038656 RepID=UPI00301A538B
MPERQAVDFRFSVTGPIALHDLRSIEWLEHLCEDILQALFRYLGGAIVRQRPLADDPPVRDIEAGPYRRTTAQPFSIQIGEPLLWVDGIADFQEMQAIVIECPLLKIISLIAI